MKRAKQRHRGPANPHVRAAIKKFLVRVRRSAKFYEVWQQLGGLEGDDVLGPPELINGTTEFVRAAAERMRNAPQFFTPEQTAGAIEIERSLDAIASGKPPKS